MQTVPQRLGLAFGAFLGGWHLVWAILVALGVAQPLMNWIFTIHMIKPFYTILPFNLGSAAILVIVTALFGYVGGWILGMIWEAVTQKK